MTSPQSPHTPPRQSALPAPLTTIDDTTDIVVVGGGGGGLPAALFSRWNGNDVILLEKADALGGTARKAAFWYWVPNNEPLRRAGLDDSEEDYLRYVARLSRPTLYDPASPSLGLPDDEYAALRAIYESASPAAELLAARGALPYRHVPDAVDYWSHLPEDRTPRGRVLIHEDAKDTMADGGAQSIRSMTEVAVRDGVDIRTRHRVQRLIRDDGRVVGVEASTADGHTVRLLARKAVIFATGGFSHDPELRRNYLSVPLFAGCAAPTNEGDFVPISTGAGAQLRNMNYAWMCPVSLEKSVNKSPNLIGGFCVAGDSTLFVNKYGQRTMNEKLPYNELAQEFFTWDAQKAEYPNLVMIQIWDERSHTHSADTEYGRLIPPPGADDSHVISADTLGDLAARIDERLRRYRGATGGVGLDTDFVPTLQSSIDRFNDFARGGVDEDFHRGEKPVQLMFNGAIGPGTSPNPTMHPIADQGPYYAALLTGGTLDTKGGPKTSTDAQVLDDRNDPIPGLYGVGNCVASPSAGSYWAGGATLGPIIAFAYRAANRASAEPVLESATASTSA
ncbi:FAD-dependent oxidoreductase [Rhodococcus opacus]|uniref:FAD-dependent oxidoreductase n=1 Tax=Rhodococcus opacus TaxID=37919 RepID=UPI002473F514|nr:FAD-dependent oxidoreductase [Rhodococcus opacus]MDH6292466.1 3-oxosteroid 1-dehydrogenase [Rhodococcus opacus]